MSFCGISPGKDGGGRGGWNIAGSGGSGGGDSSSARLGDVEAVERRRKNEANELRLEDSPPGTLGVTGF